MDYAAMGRRIKAARRDRNITQEGLAASAGISLSFLGHIERGTRKASLETLIKLANALGVSVDPLVRDSLKYQPRQPVTPPMELLHKLKSPQLEQSARKARERRERGASRKNEEQEALAHLRRFIEGADGVDGADDIIPRWDDDL